MKLGRRALGLCFLAAACRPKGERPAPSPPEGLTLRDLSFEGGPSTRALVISPKTGGPFPVLVALHGRGEAVRGAEAGAYGWLRDYKLDRTLAAVGRGRVSLDELEGHGTAQTVADLERELRAHPYRGLVIVCPHTPDVLAGARSLDAADAFADFVVETLVPRVAKEAPVTGKVGLDGVSLGGRVALLTAARHPTSFHAVGTLQAAVREPEVAAFADRVALFRSKSKAPLRLLTSTDDPFKPPLAALSAELEKRNLAHEHLVVPGPHDYSFNRGPGGVAMVMFHDRALRA